MLANFWRALATVAGSARGSASLQITLQQRRGPLDVGERVVELRESDHDLARLLRLVAILAQHPLRAGVDHRFRSGRPGAPIGNRCPEQPRQLVSDRLLAVRVPSGGVALDLHPSRLPCGSTKSHGERQHHEHHSDALPSDNDA